MKRLRGDQVIDSLLRSADPAAPFVMSTAIDKALDALGARLIEVNTAPSATLPSKRARRAPASVIAGGLAALLLGGLVATAAQYTTHTGFFGQEDGRPAGEWLRPDAPDFVATARELTKGFVFAPGDTADNYW